MLRRCLELDFYGDDDGGRRLATWLLMMSVQPVITRIQSQGR